MSFHVKVAKSQETDRPETVSISLGDTVIRFDNFGGKTFLVTVQGPGIDEAMSLSPEETSAFCEGVSSLRTKRNSG